MLAKLTSKNQLTLPKVIVQQVNPAEYFNVSIDEGRIILTPVFVQAADAVRSKLEEMGITEQEVTDAVTWARQA